MIEAADVARLRQAMILGLARQPLQPPAAIADLFAASRGEGPAPATDTALALLAITGQRLRFERPAPTLAVVPEAARHLHADPRPILPEAARRAVLRVPIGLDKSIANVVMPAVLGRLAASGFRLHPFDLPAMLFHLKSAPGSMGLSERAFVALTTKADDGAPDHLLHASITAENWASFPKAARRSFLENRRRGDPAAARALLESCLKTDPAPVRAELIEALRVGLSEGDVSLLEKLAIDRADSVKKAAQLVLSHVPGTPARQERLAAAARCFTRGGGVAGSLLRAVGVTGGSAASVEIELPEGRTVHERGTAFLALIDGLGLAELSEATGFTPAALAEAVADYESFFDLLLQTAIRSSETQSIMTLVDARMMDPGPYPHAAQLSLIASALPRGLPVQLADRLLASPSWTGRLLQFGHATLPSEFKDDGTVALTAALMPASRMPAFLETLKPLPLATTAAARAVADLLAALAAPASEPPSPSTDNHS